MKIGIDIDGVILDYERVLKTYGDLYDFIELKKNGIIYRNEHYLRNRYDWTEEERMNFVNKYFLKLSKKTQLIPGAKDVIDMLRKENNELIVISARGGMIDEMQDVREWEYNVIKELFENVTFQKIGDPNQQIYDKTIWEINNELKIKNSLRNSINIAKFANNFEVKNTNMKGNIQNNIKVKFIIFNKTNIDKVKEVFGKEIIKNKLDEKEDTIFKMIGAVKKQHKTNITLYNYINQKVQMLESSKLEYILRNNLDKYNIYKSMLETLYEAYKFVDIKKYAKIESKEGFFEEVEKYIDKEKILNNIKKDVRFENLCELQKAIIKDTLGKIINEEYLNNRIMHFYKQTSNIKIENTDSNYFILDNDGKKIKINYGTISSVKGETHTATLVCETFNKYYDIENVFEKHIKLHQKLKTTDNFLHKLYVGFTRPTDMLCVAITNDTYNKFKKEIKDLNIEIIYVGDDENET